MSVNSTKNSDYGQKLKKDIQSIFKQLKTGCYRSLCYNPYCKKYPGFCSDQKLNSFGNDKELLAFCLNFVKTEDNIETYICLELSDIGYKSSVVGNLDDWIGKFSTKINPCDFNNKMNIELTPKHNGNTSEIVEANKTLDFDDLDIYFDPNKALADSYVQSIDLILEVANFNKAFQVLLSKLVNEKKIMKKNTNEGFTLIDNKAAHIVPYIFRIYFNFFNYCLQSENFMYCDSSRKDIEEFFNKFNTILLFYRATKGANIKSHPQEKFIYKLFSLYSSDQLLRIINFLQNFLTILLVDLTQQKPTLDDLILLVGLMKVFELIYFSNIELKLLDKTSFYNDSINNYLSIKAQCINHFKFEEIAETVDLYNLKKEAEYFSFIKYYYMYDTGSKREILSIFSLRAQSLEVNNSILSLDSLLMGAQSLYFILKVRRNHLVEDTLDKVSGNQNFRKPLKVKFEGEQGVDEGGVKKEFFMLMTRQLFDPDYGMFTYHEVS